MKTFEIRFKVPHCDREQSVYGFKFRTVNAESEAMAKESLPFNSYSIHVTHVPYMDVRAPIGAQLTQADVPELDQLIKGK